MNSESRLPYGYEPNLLVEVESPELGDREFEASPILDQGKASVSHCDSAIKEEMFRLAQSITLSAPAGRHMIAFSGVAGADRSEIICMRTAELLAFSFGYSVCVLDANPAAPSPTRMGWVTGNPSKIVHMLRPSSPGSHGRLFLLEKNQIAPFLKAGVRSDLLQDKPLDLRQSFDYVMISAPPPHDSQFPALARQVDGVILAVGAANARREIMLRAKRIIEFTHAESTHGRLIGTVLTDRRFPIPQWLFKRLGI